MAHRRKRKSQGISFAETTLMTFSALRSSLCVAALAASICALVPACKNKEPENYYPQCGSAEWSHDIILAGAADVPVVGQCMARAPAIDLRNEVACLVISGRADPSCNCNSPGLTDISQVNAVALDDVKQHKAAEGLDCFCTVQQLTDAAGDPAGNACRSSEDTAPTVNGKPIDGYCYVDPSAKLGNPKLVEHCPDTDRHLLRFVGDVTHHDGALFIYCSATVCGYDESQ
jgi:hypothetical protein